MSKKKIAKGVVGVAVLTELIIGSVNWYDAKLASPEKVSNVEATGMIINHRMGGRCTAWKKAHNQIGTNHHCVSTQEGAAATKVTFDGKKTWYQCSELLFKDKPLDIAILKCDLPDLPNVKFYEGQTAYHGDAYMVHVNCHYYLDSTCTPNKLISEGKIDGIDTSGLKLFHDLDTLGGSSGSPIFNPEGYMVGLHNSGYRRATNNGETWQGDFNGAIDITDISPVLSSLVVSNVPTVSYCGFFCKVKRWFRRRRSN